MHEIIDEVAVAAIACRFYSQMEITTTTTTTLIRL